MPSAIHCQAAFLCSFLRTSSEVQGLPGNVQIESSSSECLEEEVALAMTGPFIYTWYSSSIKNINFLKSCYSFNGLLQ